MDLEEQADWDGLGRAGYHNNLRLHSIFCFPDTLLSAFHETHFIIILIIDKVIIIFTFKLKKLRYRFVQ